MTGMESLCTLGLSGQPRAPAWVSGCGAGAGPGDVALDAAAPADGTPFAQALREWLGVAARPTLAAEAGEGEAVAPFAADAPSRGERTRDTEGLEESAEATDATRPKTRQGARADAAPATAAPATLVAPAAALIPVPLDLIQEAASSEPAPEPSQASADEMRITPLASVSATAAATGVEQLPAASLATPAMGAVVSPRADVAEAKAPEREEQPEVATAPTAEPASTTPGAGGITPDAEAAPAPHEPLTAPTPAEASHDVAAPAMQGITADDNRRGRMAAEGANAAGADGAPLPHAAAPSAGVQDVAQAARAEAPVSATSATSSQREEARDPAAEPPADSRQSAPAKGAPEFLPEAARATVVQWLHGAESVDEGRALQGAQRILVENLAEDIHRLTFVGQSRAVLQLQPPDLGKLSIHLTMQEGGLAVEMVVESEAVKAIVESTLGQLQSALAQHGLATAGVFVQVGEGAQRDAETWQAPRGREPRHAPRAVGRLEDAPPPPGGRIVGYGSTVDYRI